MARDTRWTDMDEYEIDEFLDRQRVGVLAFARGGEAYSVPIAFGYEESRDRCVFQFIVDDDSTKQEYLENTTVASLTVYDWQQGETWRSVVLRGPLQPVASDDVASAASVFSMSGELAALDVFDKPVEEHEPVWYELRIDEKTGRAVYP